MLTTTCGCPIRAGQVVHIPAGVVHAVIADQGDRIVSVGGPSPPDYVMLTRTKVWTGDPL